MLFCQSYCADEEITITVLPPGTYEVRNIGTDYSESWANISGGRTSVSSNPIGLFL